MNFKKESNPPLAAGASYNPETAIPYGLSAWFGGPGVRIGPRIAPLIATGIPSSESDSDLSSEAILGKQLEAEADCAIQYRTCSWRKTAALLFSEYICLAIMSFPWSYSILGLVPGLIFTVLQALLVLYTYVLTLICKIKELISGSSLILWEFCLRHPEVRDVCDIGQMLFWGKTWAWYFTAVMFILNNTFIQALHVLIGAEYANTIVGPNSSVGCQTVVFGVITTLICWLASLPRTFDMLSKLGTASAVFTFISVLLATIFSGIEAHPAGFNAEPTVDPDTGSRLPSGNPIFTAIPVTGTTFVAGLNAFLNISYTFIGQITLPSFIAEMRDPRDFPKALWTCTILEIIVFSIVGSIIYVYTVVLWIAAFIIANVIPFFSSLLSLMSSLFDSFFGFIFWGLAYFRMREADGHISLIKDRTVHGWLEGVLNVVIILTGFFFLTAGTYVSVQSIVDQFESGSVGTVFQCASNGI
ncbi:hypothetical protein DL764_009578 [Monosporascus ibericus]|uniref:Amino acid transporter transmembrane domain-containing protein n=1 Tax=Monosporascus ibericus TaxID=155417 RepID=A0A4Q4SUK7_9PEZI|nr:hypothetical protein DL764_009578 [Monosporascus ibericus]